MYEIEQINTDYPTRIKAKFVILCRIWKLKLDIAIVYDEEGRYRCFYWIYNVMITRSIAKIILLALYIG
jgi:hypothetical protein